jgi:hypothetical protein
VLAAATLRQPVEVGAESSRALGFIGRSGSAGPYLFRIDSGNAAGHPESSMLLEVDVAKRAAREVRDTRGRLVGSGNGSLALAAIVRTRDRLEVVSRNGDRWKSEGFIPAPPTSDPVFTVDHSGAKWAVVRSGTSRNSEVFRQEGSRWRSVLKAADTWIGDPCPDPDDRQAIDWGLLQISPTESRRWSEPPAADSSAFLFRRFPQRGGAAIRMDGIPAAFLLGSDGRWTPLQVGPWEPALSKEVSQLDSLTGFDPDSLVLRWELPEHAVRFGRVSRKGWEVLFETPALGVKDAWREPRAIAPNGLGYAAFSMFSFAQTPASEGIAMYVWLPGAPVRALDVKVRP